MIQEDEDLGESIRLYYHRLRLYVERAAKDFVRDHMPAYVSTLHCFKNRMKM